MKRLVKAVLIGGEGVGKTCLLEKFETGKFNPQQKKKKRTFGFSTIRFNENFQLDVIIFQVWDVSHKAASNIKQMCCKDVDIVFLCFDLSNASSFDNLQGELDFVRKNSEKDPHVVLIGLKSDLPRVIDNETIKTFMAKNNLPPAYRVSAKKHDANYIGNLFAWVLKKFLQPDPGNNKNFINNFKLAHKERLAGNGSCFSCLFKRTQLKDPNNAEAILDHAVKKRAFFKGRNSTYNILKKQGFFADNNNTLTRKALYDNTFNSAYQKAINSM